MRNVEEELAPGHAMSLLDFDDDSEEEEVKDVTPTTDHSDSHLSRLDDLPKSLVSSIDSVTREMRTRGDLFDNEAVVGVDECHGVGSFHEAQGLLVVLTTHHLLWLDTTSKSLVQVTNIADAKVMLLSASRDSMALYVQGNSTWVKSAKIADLIKGVQESYQPLKGHFLPYAVFEHPIEMQKALVVFPAHTMANLYSYENLQLLNVIVAHGSVGEKIAYVKESIMFAVGVRAECIFVLTDEAIYSLNRDFSLELRVRLADVEAVLVGRREEAVGVQTQTSRFYWKAPLTLSETLEKHLRARTGRNLKAVFSKSIELSH